jgi:hypothetical protein
MFIVLTHIRLITTIYAPPHSVEPFTHALVAFYLCTQVGLCLWSEYRKLEGTSGLT